MKAVLKRDAHHPVTSVTLRRGDPLEGADLDNALDKEPEFEHCLSITDRTPTASRPALAAPAAPAAPAPSVTPPAGNKE